MPIRITPLIDVVFILLVFFMLTTRLMPTDHFELENTTASRGSSTGEARPELMLQASGALHWQGRSWATDELVATLAQGGDSDVNLVVSGDASLATFTQTLGALDQAGLDVRWQRSPPSDTGN